MKKTLVTLAALAMASVASAVTQPDQITTSDYNGSATAFFANLSKDSTDKGISYSKTTSMFTGTLSYIPDMNYAEDVTSPAGQGTNTSAYTLDLAGLGNYVDDETKTGVVTLLVFSYEYNNRQHALQMDADGDLYFAEANTTSTDWDSATWAAWGNGGSTTLSSLSEDVVIRSGIDPKFASDDGYNAIPFFVLYNDQADVLMGGEGLSSRTNGLVTRIWVNTNYISAVAIDATASLNETGIRYLAAAVPEPTTATLSLLALAGLAARRRRK